MFDKRYKYQSEFDISKNRSRQVEIEWKREKLRKNHSRHMQIFHECCPQDLKNHFRK